MLETLKRVEDLEQENAKSKSEAALLRGRLAEQEAYTSFLISNGQIPEEALDSATSVVLKREDVCPEVLSGSLGAVTPDRPSALLTMVTKDPKTLIRLSVRQARAQALWSA